MVTEILKVFIFDRRRIKHSAYYSRGIVSFHLEMVYLNFESLISVCVYSFVMGFIALDLFQ